MRIGGRVQFKTVCHATRPVSSEAHAETHRSWSGAVLPNPRLCQISCELVPHLAPEMLHQLIAHRGLDVCAEIVASATATQLASVLDLDLWRSAQPGHDERFDTERFGEWLEVLVDAGGTVAARTVAAMDEHLVVAGLSRYVRVFDPAAIAATSSMVNHSTSTCHRTQVPSARWAAISCVASRLTPGTRSSRCSLRSMPTITTVFMR